jgi:hypothetical protein
MPIRERAIWRRVSCEDFHQRGPARQSCNEISEFLPQRRKGRKEKRFIISTEGEIVLGLLAFALDDTISGSQESPKTLNN